jgi:hypothetical protein
MSDKLTKRILLRLTEDQDRQVRALVELHALPITYVLRFLITFGLERVLSEGRKEMTGKPRQLLSTAGNSRQPRSESAA